MLRLHSCFLIHARRSWPLVPRDTLEPPHGSLNLSLPITATPPLTIHCRLQKLCGKNFDECDPHEVRQELLPHSFWVRDAASKRVWRDEQQLVGKCTPPLLE